MKQEREAAGSSDSDSSDDEFASARSSANSGALDSTTSMEAFLAKAREVLGGRSVSRLERALANKPARGTKRRLTGGASDAPSLAVSRAAPKRARRAPKSVPSASTVSTAVTEALADEDVDSDNESDSTEQTSDVDEEQRQIRLAQRLSLIEGDPTLAPEEIRRKAKANDEVKKAGGVSSFVQQVAGASSDAAGDATSTTTTTTCFICLDKPANVHTLCESTRGRVTARQTSDMHRAVCHDCWKMLEGKQRLTCMQCQTRILSAFLVKSEANSTSVRRLDLAARD